MFIVGKTEQMLVNGFSYKKAFEIDEYYKICDSTNNNPIGRVVESYEYSGIDSIEDLDVDIKNEINEILQSNNIVDSKIYLCKIKLETEINKPIQTKSLLSNPLFDDLRPLIMKGEDGLHLGVIRGSNAMYETLPNHLKDVAPMLVDGKIKKQDMLPFVFDIHSFNQYPHLGLFGGSGSGKTYGFNVILEEIIKKRIPTIILDPHFEMNFNKINKDIPDHLKFNFKDNVEILQVGVDIGIPFSDITTDEFINILQFAGNLTQPMVSTLTAIHEEGDTFILLNDRLKTLIHLFELDEKRELKEEDLNPIELKLFKQYRLEVSGLPTLKALQWRINAIERENIFKNNIQKAREALFKRKTIVIRGTNRHLNMLSSYMLNKFYKERRNYIDAVELGIDGNPFPPFIVGIDEAHIFAPKGEFSSPTKKILKTISQEGRKYGVYEILATQRPAILDETIVSQLSSKIIFRTTISEDIKMIEKETDLDITEIGRLPYLSSGNAFLSSAVIGNTLSIRFRANFTEGKIGIHPFDELSDFDYNDELEDEIIKALPFSSSNLEDVLNKLKDKNLNINIMDLEKTILDLTNKKMIKADNTPFGFFYDKI